MCELEVKVVEQDRMAEIQKEIAQSNQKLQEKLAEAIGRMNESSRTVDVKISPNEVKTQPVVVDVTNKFGDNSGLNKLLDSIGSLKDELKASSDNQVRRLIEMDSRIRTLEDSQRLNRQDSNSQVTNEALNKMVDLLQSIVKSNPEIAGTLNDIKTELRKVTLEDQEVQVRSKPISTGYPVTRADHRQLACRCQVVPGTACHRPLAPTCDFHQSRSGAGQELFLEPARGA